MATARYRRLWDRVIFLKTDVKAFFGRVCADGLSDSDITAIVEEYAQRLKKRTEVRTSPLIFLFHHPHMRSLHLPERRGKNSEKQKRMKRRSISSHCVMKSAISIPILKPILTRDSRVLEKLKEEGWAQELETHPSAYLGLKDITGVRVAKSLTDKGTLFVAHPPRSLRTR